MQTETKSERVVKSLRASLLIDELDAHIVTAQHFARVTQEELEQLDLKTTDPKQKLLISPFGSIRWSRHLMALLYARQQAMLFMMDACARQLGEDSPFKDDPLFIELAGTSSFEHYERALMFALGARPTTSGPSGRRSAGPRSGSRAEGMPSARRPAPGVRVSRTPTGGASRPPGSAASRTAQRGSRSNRGRFVELYAHDDEDSPMPPHDCGGYNGTASPDAPLSPLEVMSADELMDITNLLEGFKAAMQAWSELRDSSVPMPEVPEQLIEFYRTWSEISPDMAEALKNAEDHMAVRAKQLELIEAQGPGGGPVTKG